MRRNLSISIVSLAIVLAIGARHESRADFQDGDTLYQKCTETGDGQAVAFCVGYAAAIADVLGRGDEDIAHWYACIPAGTTQGEIFEVARQWLHDHPDNRDASASDNLAQAMSDAYPCSK